MKVLNPLLFFIGATAGIHLVITCKEEWLKPLCAVMLVAVSYLYGVTISEQE